MKNKIFIFLDGVAYPFHAGYHVRVGVKWRITNSNEYPNHYQLVKDCRVNTYRYPFVQFCKDDYELQIVPEKVGTKAHVIECLGTNKITITRR